MYPEELLECALQLVRAAREPAKPGLKHNMSGRMMVNDSIGQFNRSIAFLVSCVTLRSKKSWSIARAAPGAQVRWPRCRRATTCQT